MLDYIPQVELGARPRELGCLRCWHVQLGTRAPGQGQRHRGAKSTEQGSCTIRPLLCLAKAPQWVWCSPSSPATTFSPLPLYANVLKASPDFFLLASLCPLFFQIFAFLFPRLSSLSSNVACSRGLPHLPSLSSPSRYHAASHRLVFFSPQHLLLSEVILSRL